MSPVGVGVAGTKTKTTKCHSCPLGSIYFSQLCLLASSFISIKKKITYQFSFHENWDNIEGMFQQNVSCSQNYFSDVYINLYIV